MVFHLPPRGRRLRLRVASVTVKRPSGLRCSAVAVASPNTYDPHGSGGGELLCQDSRPASVSGGLIGSIFEDPEAVLKSRHLSDFGPVSPSRIRRRRGRRVCCDYHDCRDSLSWHENLSPRDTPSHFFLTNGIKPFGLVTKNTLLPNPMSI